MAPLVMKDATFFYAGQGSLPIIVYSEIGIPRTPFRRFERLVAPGLFMHVGFRLGFKRNMVVYPVLEPGKPFTIFMGSTQPTVQGFTGPRRHGAAGSRNHATAETRRHEAAETWSGGVTESRGHGFTETRGHGATGPRDHGHGSAKPCNEWKR